MSAALLPEVLEYFRKQGAKGGKIGGKRSLETMTPEERSGRTSMVAAVGPLWARQHEGANAPAIGSVQER